MGILKTVKLKFHHQSPSVQLLSRVCLFATPEPQHAMPPCLSPTPRVHPYPCSIEMMMPSDHLILCRPFLLKPSIFPSIRVFSNESALLIRWAKYCISIASVVFPINIQSWFPLGLTGWISLLSKRHSRVFSSTTVWKRQFSLPYGPTLTSIRAYWKNHSFDYMDIWDILLP